LKTSFIFIVIENADRGCREDSRQKPDNAASPRLVVASDFAFGMSNDASLLSGIPSALKLNRGIAFAEDRSIRQGSNVRQAPTGDPCLLSD
jgi:hypothetical protein